MFAGQILADQALEEGRHTAALRLYRSALASNFHPTPPSTLPLSPSDYGDVLYGVGVALLAAGEFWEARHAWERYVLLEGYFQERGLKILKANTYVCWI